MDPDALLMSLISFVIMYTICTMYTLALTPNYDLKRFTLTRTHTHKPQYIVCINLLFS